MEDMRFETGEFVVWKGNIYRVRAYQKEYALFAVRDTERRTQLFRIPRTDAEDCYTQFAECDFEGIRYQAHYIRLEKCWFSSVYENKLLHEPLSEINEIWIKQLHFDTQRLARRGKQIKTIWHNPFCQDSPSQKTFCVEKMANGNLITSYLEEQLSLKKTTELLKACYQDRIRIVQIETPFWDTYVRIFCVDNQRFNMTLDYGIISISPEKEAGNPYIREIVTYFNSEENQV